MLCMDGGLFEAMGTSAGVKASHIGTLELSRWELVIGTQQRPNTAKPDGNSDAFFPSALA